jgi:hypothetical protein
MVNQTLAFLKVVEFKQVTAFVEDRNFFLKEVA